MRSGIDWSIVATRERQCGLVLSASDRQTVEHWIQAGTTPQRLVQRSQIVLAVATGLSDRDAAREVGTTRTTVRLWRRRFEAGGPEALMTDAPGRGRKPKISPADLDEAARESSGARLSVRALARRMGASASSVHRALSRTKRT